MYATFHKVNKSTHRIPSQLRFRTLKSPTNQNLLIPEFAVIRPHLPISSDNLIAMQTTDDEFSSLKCRYASKRCWNLRAIKRNGERHNLCEMHRQKANSNQRRLDKKRKAGQVMLGLPHHLQGGFDLERRMRLRLKLERELGGVPLTTQFIRPPTSSLVEAAGLLAIGSSYRSDWRDSRLPSVYAAYPRSPRAMLRVAALAKMKPSIETRGWMSLSPLKAEMTASPTLLPPIATAVARSGEGLVSSGTLQHSWQPDVRRPSLVTRTHL